MSNIASFPCPTDPATTAGPAVEPRPGTWVATVVSRVSALSVALIAGYSSYLHIAHVALRYGERREIAYALPFAIDGLLIVATTAMLDDNRHGRHLRWSARWAFAFGVTASLAANIASATPTLGARIVAAVPAIALLLAVEVVFRTGRPRTDTPNTSATAAGPVAATAAIPAGPIPVGSATVAGSTPAIVAPPGVTGSAVWAAKNGHDPRPTSPSTDAYPPATGGRAPSTVDTAGRASTRPRLPAATDTAHPATPTSDHSTVGQPVTGRPQDAATGHPTGAATRPPATATVTGGRPGVGWSTAAKVAALLATDPHTDTMTVAARLGISPRSARRHMANHKPGPGPTTAAIPDPIFAPDRHVR